LQDGFALAKFQFDADAKRVVRIPESGNGGSGAAGEPTTRFLVYRDGRVYFEGQPEEIAASKDAYLQRFLV